MRVCLLPLKTVVRQPGVNLAHLARRLEEVAAFQPDLVCLPECALTGYLYEKDDLRCFAELIPGPAVEQMAQLARRYSTYLCFGLLETAGSDIYNAGVLLDRAGKKILHHRKNEEKPPFTNGIEVESVQTELGRLGILICGDLFNPAVVAKLHPQLDWLLMPMSRSFDGQSPDADRWVREERQVYLEAVKAAGMNTLIVNSLETHTDDPAFGGAMVVSSQGVLLAESPHGTDQALFWEA